MTIFYTSQGSRYEFDPRTNTSIREKRSGGSSQGIVHDPLSCIFLNLSKPLPLFTRRIRVGYRGEQGFISVDSVREAMGEPLGVIVINRNSGEVEDLIPPKDVSLTPKIGYRPYEWDRKNRHLGNEIVKIES